MFVAPSLATSFFHQWQKQRKMWWRKFSASPDRYNFQTDANANDNNTQVVEISAKYPWGSQVMESVTLDTNSSDFNVSQLQFKEGKQLVNAHIVVNEIDMATMFLNALYDAFDEPMFQDKPRQLFRFHRKLAPYKISFAISDSDAASLSELNELGLYLSRQLRTNRISTLLLPSSSRIALEAQYKQYDQFGVPYTIVLNKNTLKNGITQLRNRDTTLKEQVHVSNLVPYVENLFKNY